MKRFMKGAMLGVTAATMLFQFSASQSVLFTAYADDEESEISSGKCGENLTYKIVDYEITEEQSRYHSAFTGLELIISGSGDMYDYDAEQPAPWHDYGFFVIEIEEGVTSIGNYAFDGNIKEQFGGISLPDSLKSIGDFAFVHENILSGSYSTELTIPRNVSYIGKGAFNHGTKSGDCMWENFYVSAENPYYCDIDGIIYTKDLTTLIACPEAKDVSNYVFPENLLYINDYAFAYNYTGFAQLNLPDSLLGIGEYSFFHTPVGYNLILPKGVSVGNNAFGSVTKCDLRNVIVPIGASIQIKSFDYFIKIYGYPEIENTALEGVDSAYWDHRFQLLTAEDVFVLNSEYDVKYENISTRNDIVTAMNDLNISDYIVYDITLQTEEDDNIQPQTPVTVLASLGSLTNTDFLHVYRLEDDGSLTDMNASVTDGFAIFEADHFSVYVLTAPQSTDETQPAEVPSDSFSESTDISEEPETTIEATTEELTTAFESSETTLKAETTTSYDSTKNISDAETTSTNTSQDQSANTGIHQHLLLYLGIMLMALSFLSLFAFQKFFNKSTR